VERGRDKSGQELIGKLAERIDSFEKYSRPHSRLMVRLATQLARSFGLAQSDINAIAEAALLHDIGLYAMAPAYHLAARPLSLEERIDLWRHPIIGEQQMAKRDAPRHAQLLVRWHHEWWNGCGYPDMLAFEDIPIGARILRAVELYSALISDRPYRPAFSQQAAREALRASAGIECDPYVVKALLALLDEAGQESLSSENAPSANFGLDVRSAAGSEQAPVRDSSELEIGSRSQSQVRHGRWLGWSGSHYNRKSLLGFEASVLRQIEFRSIAIVFCGWARLDWYLKFWGKQILSNDPRAWAAAASRAMVEASEPLTSDEVSHLLEDVYVPGAKLANAALRRWFGEVDAWWMDNLRRNIDGLSDQSKQAQAILLGLLVGDYALSLDGESLELKRPLSAVFRQLAKNSFELSRGHQANRSYNLPAEEFIRQARADLLFLNLPSAHSEDAGSEARSHWRSCWVLGSDCSEDIIKLTRIPQSKHSYLVMVDELLRAAAHIRHWAIEYQEAGLASAREVSELIKEHACVRATYSKDLTEVAGGLRNYITLAEKA
jgi:hypothetical protein